MQCRDFFGLSIDLSSTAVITSPEMCIESQLCGLSETNLVFLNLARNLSLLIFVTGGYSGCLLKLLQLFTVTTQQNHIYVPVFALYHHSQLRQKDLSCLWALRLYSKLDRCMTDNYSDNLSDVIHNCAYHLWTLLSPSLCMSCYLHGIIYVKVNLTSIGAVDSFFVQKNARKLYVI
jgi:hypothetical protein